jgi:hypothetical protein
VDDAEMPSFPSRVLGVLAAAAFAPAAAAAQPVAHELPVNVAPDATVANLQYISDVGMASDGRFAVVYLEANAGATATQVYVQRFAATLTKVGERIAVGAPSTSNTPFASLAMAADGRFAVAWIAVDGSGNQRLRVQRYTPDGAPDGAVISPDGETPVIMGVAPAIAMAADGRFAVAWTANAGGVLVTRVRAYTAAGAPTAAGTTDLDTTSRDTAHPSIGMAPDGRFAVTWYDYDFPPPGDPLPSGTVPGRRFAADGTPAGARVELYTGGPSQNYVNPSIGLAADGSAFLAFQGLQCEPGCFEQDVWARRLDAALAPRGDRFSASDYTTYSQIAPDVAVDGDGGALVAFEGQEGTQQLSYLRRFGPGGAADGGNLRVGPASPSGNLRHTAVASDGAARAVVTWTYGINGAGGDVFVARYDYAPVTDPTNNGGGGGGGGGGGTPAGPGAPPVSGQGPSAPPAAPPSPAKPAPPQAKAPRFADLVALPPARSCVSRRRFSIRLRVPKGSPVVQATVKVNNKRVAVRKGARLRSTVDLRSLPKGRFTVAIELKLADGRVVAGQRRYKTCAKKERGGRPPV